MKIIEQWSNFFEWTKPILVMSFNVTPFLSFMVLQDFFQESFLNLLDENPSTSVICILFCLNFPFCFVYIYILYFGCPCFFSLNNNKLTLDSTPPLRKTYKKYELKCQKDTKPLNITGPKYWRKGHFRTERALLIILWPLKDFPICKCLLLGWEAKQKC